MNIWVRRCLIDYPARIVDVVWLGYRLLVTAAAILCVATVVPILVLAQFGIRFGW